MKKTWLALGCAIVASAAFAVTVSDVAVAYDKAAGTMTIGYSVDEDAIVTFGVSIAGKALSADALANLTEAANRKVTSGAHEVSWNFATECPERKFKASDLAVSVTAWPTNRGPDYMVVDLVTENLVTYYASTNDLPQGVGSDLYRTTKMLFRKIPASGVVCRMGTPAKEVGRYPYGSSDLVHYVKFTKDYYLGVFEVTQKQFQLIHGNRPSAFNRNTEDVWGTRPVENVNFSYYDDTSKSNNTYLRDPVSPDETTTDEELHAVTTETAFIYEMRAKTGLGLYLDLPTYSQWEYACRAGTDTPLYTGEALASTDFTVEHTELNAIARYRYNAGEATSGTVKPGETMDTLTGTARVGSYAPNAWGLYDMYGNVEELCLDFWNSHTSNTIATPYEDYKGPATGYTTQYNYRTHVIAGGAWNSTNVSTCYRSGGHSTIVFNASTSVGFRMCLTLK